MHLPSIERGGDSFEWRLWLHVSTDIINLIRIRFTLSSWTISETIIWSHIPDYEFRRNDTVNHLLSTVIDSSTTRLVVPVLPVNQFIDSLNYYNLQQAIPNSQINNSFQLSTDAWNYTFEIADGRNYRIITYVCSGGIVPDEAFHAKIRQFLRFIRNQLSIKFRPC